MSEMAPAAAIKFLNEMASYWERRPTEGEDMAHWAGVYNAENCRKIAALVEATRPDASLHEGEAER